MSKCIDGRRSFESDRRLVREMCGGNPPSRRDVLPGDEGYRVYESGPWITGRTTIPTGEYAVGARVVYKDHEGECYTGTVVSKEHNMAGNVDYMVWIDDFDALRANRRGCYADSFNGPLSLTQSMLDAATPW